MAFIFQLIYTNNTAIESYEHVDYAGLKDKGSGEKMTKKRKLRKNATLIKSAF